MIELPNKTFFRVDEVAAIFQLSPRTIRRMVEDEKIPVLKLRGAVRISRTVLVALIDRKMDNHGQ